MKRRDWLPYALVALTLVAVAWLDLIIYPQYFLGGLLSVPLIIAAFLLPSRHTAVVIVLVLAIAIVDAGRAAELIPTSAGRVVALTIVSLFAYLMNVQRERAQRQVVEAQRSAAELEAIFSSVGVSILLHGPEGKFLRMNEDARRLLNPPPGFEELPIERRLAESHVEDAQGKPLPIDQIATARALRGETVRGQIEAIQLPGRDRVWVSSNASPIFVGGRLAGTVLAMTDITEIRKLTELAERRAGDLQAVISNIVDAVVVCDDRGYITLTNQAAVNLFGLKEPADGTESLAALYEARRILRLDGTPVSTGQNPLARALAGEVAVAETEIIRAENAGQDVFIRTSAASVRDAAGRIVGAVAVSRDVTEFVELDRMKDDFIKVAAHELKTPVAILKGYAQAFARIEQARPEQRDRMLAAIDEGANRISMIVEDLLDISQLQIGQLKPRRERVDLLKAVQEVMNRMAPRAPNHQLNLVKAEPAIVEGDRERLEEVVTHLIENAVKFSPKGGDIDTAVERRSDEVVVFVRDYGVGIPREKQQHIFERFYRAHTGTPYDYGGMGVGLYVSRELIQLQGGRMWFESEEGEGTTFYFSLPIRGQDGGR